MEVAATPVMETDADLKDAVIEMAYRGGRVPPQQLERFVLFEELPGVELLDAAQESLRCGIGAARARGLVGCVGRLPFVRARGLTRAATRLGRARIR